MRASSLSLHWTTAIDSKITATVPAPIWHQVFLSNFGILIAIINKASNGKAIKKKDFSCEGCPSAAACNGQNCAEKREAAAK